MGAAIAAIGGAIAGGIASEITSQQQAGAEKAALRLRQEQQRLATANKKFQLGQRLERTISSATAAQGASGLSLGSASFSAIQSNSFNNFANDDKILNINQAFQDEATSQEINNINKNSVLNALKLGFGANQQIGQDIETQRAISQSQEQGQGAYGASNNLFEHQRVVQGLPNPFGDKTSSQQ